MHKFKALVLALLFSLTLHAQTDSKNLLSILQTFSKTSAVTGRENEAADFVQSLFTAGTLKKDKLGNLVLTVGVGSPRRLFAAPLDEPGYVVSAIQEGGYLRITPIGYGHSGNMYHQFLQGNEVHIGMQNHSTAGIAVIPSAHYEGLRTVPENTKQVYKWQETFIDVGVSSAKAVDEKGIRLLDPVTSRKKPVIIGDAYLAAPAVSSKASVIALATVAKTLLQEKFTGSVVIAFTTLELLNGKGIEDVVTRYGPFDQVIRFNRFLTSSSIGEDGILVNKDLPFAFGKQRISNPTLPFRHPSTLRPDWDTARVFDIGLTSLFPNTPVEMISVEAVSQLAQTWLRAVENKPWKMAPLPSLITIEKVPSFKTFVTESSLLKKLIERNGVSGSEKPVRDFILSQLPKWAKPIVDEKGNIVLTFGKGKQHIGFVAHMDEVGYAVDSIHSDGMLGLKQRGGFFNWVWEAQPAVVHTSTKEIPAVFAPRTGYMTATARSNGNITPKVFAGFNSKTEAIAAGVVEGLTTVTMPKQMIRMSEEKATARGFDDRVGCAGLLGVLQSIDPETLPFKVTFVWSVEEETGLAGAAVAAKHLKDLEIVYPIDTYVSSDDPLDPRIFGFCPLGSGAVIRVLESINIVSREHLAYLQELAEKNDIKVQYGMTAGGTDGQPFLKYDIPSVPLSWPGRYSHSPVEVMDFRDMNSLVMLIKAIITDSNKVY
jgi:putative aminopeptidase FrvX